MPFFGKKTEIAPIGIGEKTLSFVPFRSGIGELKIVLSNTHGYFHSYSFLGTDIQNLNIVLDGYDSFWIERESFFGVKQPIKIAIK